MSKTLHIRIPEPCHESRHDMTHQEQAVFADHVREVMRIAAPGEKNVYQCKVAIQ